MRRERLEIFLFAKTINFIPTTKRYFFFLRKFRESLSN